MSAPFRLRVESGPNAGQTFTLASAGTTIGRQDGNTIVLDDGRLSRQHARIDLGPGGLTLTDLGSANGTRINGQRVSGTQPLRTGDQLQLGETTIVIEDGTTATPDAQASAPVHPAAAATTPLAPMGSETSPRLIRERDGRSFPIDRAALVIGRQAGSGITLTDTQASRQHARIEVRSGQLTVTDLGSANGTRVNGTLISAPTTLREGDQLQIGTSLFRVELGNCTAAGAGSAGATVSGGLPPVAAPPPFGASPPSGTAPLPPLSDPPPPQFAPAPPAWGASPVAQFGAPPAPIGQVGMPPPPARARRSGLPLILGGIAVLVLLLCIGGGIGGVLLLRNRDTATPTPMIGSVAGTSVAGGGNLLTPTVVAPVFPGGSSGPVTFPGGGGGGNPAPPAPSAAPAPTLAPLPSATVAAAPSATPTPLRPTATLTVIRPPLTPTTARPMPTVAARMTPTPPPSGSGRAFTVQTVGLRFVLPATWTQERDEAGLATFLSSDKRAQVVVRWSTQTPAGLTAQKLVQDELQRTANEDPSFDVSSVPIGAITFGGQQGYGSEPYSYSLQDGTRLTEADRGVVLTGQAQYFFNFTALETDFGRYGTIFESIISTVVITGP